MSLSGQPGAALFLGCSEAGKIGIITQVWSLQDYEQPAIEGGVYLPPAPPALIRQAHDARIADPFACVTNPATCRLGEQFCGADSTLGGNPQMYEDMTRTPQFQIAMEAAFSKTTRKDGIAYLNALISAVDWTHMQPLMELPASSQIRDRMNGLIGQTLSLQGNTIELVYVTSPVPCFAHLDKQQLDWFNGAMNRSKGVYFHCPVIQSPVALYICEQEGWALCRLKKQIHLPLSLVQGTHFTSAEKDTFFLKCFAAAAELGDVTALYGFWDQAKQAAITLKQEHIFVQAAQKLLLLLSQVGHPHLQREESSHLYSLGEVHEARASWLLREGQVEDGKMVLLESARCYHAAALRTHQFMPNRYCRFRAYNALAVTLRRLDDFEMAKRAYMWALTDPTSWLNPILTKGSNRPLLRANLGHLYDMKQKTEKERQKVTKIDLKGQRSVLKTKKQKEEHYKVWCRHCKKVLKEVCGDEQRCARCLASYCSKFCQQADWPLHKSTCQSNPPRSKDLTAPESFTSLPGPCADATRALLSETLDWSSDGSVQAWTLSLAQAESRAVTWTTRYSQGIDLPP